MKHSAKVLLSLILMLSILGGCSRAVQAEDLAGKNYIYEKDGFGGPFVISLEEDGSFTYYEGALSSYIGAGDWTVEGDTLTLQEETQRFTFQVKGEDLIFRQEGSGDFLYVDVSNGEKFTVQK